MSIPTNRDEARAKVKSLTEAFRKQELSYTRSGSSYNETQVRTDFISPLLEAFGWDVQNLKRQPLDLREVFEEATVEVGEERLSKKPDYELRLAHQRKLFIEAKKPSVRIETDRSASFQTRRYGFSASLPISVLTNFYQLAIYDCIPVPSEDDEAYVARIALYSYKELYEKFDEIYDQLSQETVYSGRFDELFNVSVSRRGLQQFDDYFLAQVRSWRERLAKDIKQNNPRIDSVGLTYIVQVLLSRIVFLRICEDREIEKYESLRELQNGATFNSLMSTLKRADKFYDSGLFRLFDDEKLGVRVSDDVLAELIEELYYPQSPYTFTVVEASVLGEIYELFLGEVIEFDGDQVRVVKKPEVRESGGVVPTPSFIVNAIVERTVFPAINSKTPLELDGFTVADICCGSGVFLVAVFERLLDHHLNWYVSQDSDEYMGSKIYEVEGGQKKLLFKEKRQILLKCIRGVDIDSNAVEVTKFSLLLKLIEDETVEGLKAFVEKDKTSVLPSLDEIIRCGNSLLSHEELSRSHPSATTELIEKINPFTWTNEFPHDIARGGFDVIVGNPPYIRIQHMVIYSPEEVECYQGELSPYRTAESMNFDKYALFVERSLFLTKNPARVGVIIPHKFISTAAGRALRKIISENRFLERIVHFGAQQVFGTQASNYTCILVLNKEQSNEFVLEKVNNLTRWRYGGTDDQEIISANRIGDEVWPLSSGSVEAVFERMRTKWSDRLGDVADIFVGVQTSADDIYIIAPKEMDDHHVIFEWNSQEWKAEREILRPFLHDVSLSAYTKPLANKVIIFPYRLGGRRATLIQPHEMEAKYPGVWSYLNARKAELEDRSIQGGSASEKQWYQYGRSQSLTKFDSEKIILPILSLEPKYTYDDENVVVGGGGNGPYYLIRPKEEDLLSIYFLMAVLCHPLSEAMVRSRTSVFRGGYYSHGKQYIEPLIVPSYLIEDQDKIATLVKQLIQLNEELEMANTPQSRDLKKRQVLSISEQIEDLVTQVFRLTASEVDLIRSVPIPS